MKNIKQIKVIGLFGEYNHQIDLNNDVNVIMGPNGVGKTCILSLLHALFSGDAWTLLDIHYNSFEVSFFSGKKIVVYQQNTLENKSITIDRLGKGENKESIVIENPLRNEDANRIIPSFFERTNSNRKYNSSLSRRIYNDEEDIKEELKHNQKLINFIGDIVRVEMIPAQRLKSLNDKTEGIDNVKIISRELQKKIFATIDEVNQVSNELDQTFPERLLDKINNTNGKDRLKTLKNLVKRVDEESEILYSTGLLSNSQTIKRNIVERLKPEEQTLLVFELYLQDYLEKLSPYKKIADKLQLFLGTLSKHFLSKKLIIGSNKKLYITSEITKDEIPIDRLSSGEQNELILFYYLIFDCDEKHLVLIDEPEISLHIKWLDKLLPIFKQIADGNSLQMLIATHSPDFVGNNTDLLQILSE